ncbi:hypothetical protein BYT27DRAFT_7254100 [Phlegmacium glaucopus]|nr:hypothetical protein BYT27DRAFT_7254100 [Phlegmacium glaucopus]
MSSKRQTKAQQHPFLHHYRKPNLCSRISLTTSNEHDPPCSTVPIPQFPQAEWLNLLSGNAVDLDHVFSNIYTVSFKTRDTIELGKNIELLHDSSTPAKSVETHGDWVIAWDCMVNAIFFVFEHRKQELQLYGKHIQRYFASLPAQVHSHIINYDRAVQLRAAQWCDLELSNFAKFTDLQIQWVHNPTNLISSQLSEPK